MMYLRDSLQLAAAKLKMHRVRTGVVIAIASLLFAAIVCLLTLLTGAARSMQSFGKEGLGGRYIVQARPIVDSTVTYYGTSDMLERLKVRTAELKAEKKAEAKRLEISYDPTSDGSLPIIEYKDGNGVSQFNLNSTSPETKQALKEYSNSLPHIAYADFQKLARAAGATNTYRSSGQGAEVSTPTSTVSAIVNGKEQLDATAKQSFGPPSGVSSLVSNGWMYFDAKLLTPFLLPGQNLALGPNGEVPAIAPMSAAEEMLGLPKLPATASASQRLERVIAVRKGIAGKTTELCYRNQASNDLINQARTQQQQEAQNKKDRVVYTPPSLRYGLPTEACGEAPVIRDVRTYDERVMSEREIAFKKKYESYEDPVQQKLLIRVVGLSQEPNYSGGFSARTILESILQSNLGSGWLSPAQAVQPGSLASRIRPSLEESANTSLAYYAEFSSLDGAKNFAKEASCQSKAGYSMSTPQLPGQPDPRVVDCTKQQKYFDISPFGNNASAIEDLRRGVWKVAKYVAPVVLVLSSLVLMGIVGKIIADSRRETAVFRALGATRFGIAQIYLTYSIFVGLIIVAVAYALGSAIALLISNRLTPDASVSAVLAYNARDVHKQFTLFGFDPYHVALIVGLVLVSALLSAIIPLALNIRRNPIRDMRDE